MKRYVFLPRRLGGDAVDLLLLGVQVLGLVGVGVFLAFGLASAR